jgi:hypothetical protein
MTDDIVSLACGGIVDPPKDSPAPMASGVHRDGCPWRESCSQRAKRTTVAAVMGRNSGSVVENSLEFWAFIVRLSSGPDGTQVALSHNQNEVLP